MFFAWERARVALGFIAASLLVPSGHGIKPCHHANQGEHRCHQGQKAKKNLEHTFTSPIFFHCGTTLWRPKGPVKAASFWQFQFLTHPNGGGGQVVELGNLLPACAVTQFSLSDSPQAVPRLDGVHPLRSDVGVSRDGAGVHPAVHGGGAVRMYQVIGVLGPRGNGGNLGWARFHRCTAGSVGGHVVLASGELHQVPNFVLQHSGSCTRGGGARACPGGFAAVLGGDKTPNVPAIDLDGAVGNLVPVVALDHLDGFARHAHHNTDVVGATGGVPVAGVIPIVEDQVAGFGGVAVALHPDAHVFCQGDVRPQLTSRGMMSSKPQPMAIAET